MLYCCVCMKKTFPALFYIICGSASESSFAPIILFRVSRCPMNFCANRKLPSKVLSDIDTGTKNYFVCSAIHFGGKIQRHSQGCIILHILLTQPTVYEIFSGKKIQFLHILKIYINLKEYIYININIYINIYIYIKNILILI